MSDRRPARNTLFFSKILNAFSLIPKLEMYVTLSLVSFGFALTMVSLTLDVHITPSTNFGESIERVVPIWYWLGIAIMIVASSYMLTRLEAKKFRIPFLISCIMMIISMRSVLAIISPLPAVGDTWSMIYRNTVWRKYGILSPEGLELFSSRYPRGWPVSFILAYLFTQGGIPLYTFYQWAPTTIFILDLVVIYLLFKELANERIGMVSAFLFTLLNTNGFFPLHYCPQTVGALFYLVAMYATVKAYKTRKPKHLTFALCTIFAVVLTHHMSTFFLGTSLAGIYLSKHFLEVQQRIREKKKWFSFSVNTDTFIRFSLSLSVLTFALWYFYGFIIYGTDATWILTQIARLLTTGQPAYQTGYYGRYVTLSPLGQISILVFPAFILEASAIALFGGILRQESLEGYLWVTLGWIAPLILAFIFGNILYGNYIEPLRTLEVITVALSAAAALFLLRIFESKSRLRKTLITIALIVVAFFSIMSIYRGAQGLVVFEPPWWMTTLILP